MTSEGARVMLTAIALQESALKYRAQVPRAYAMGWWQFERNGGVKGVLRHRATRGIAQEVCDLLEYPAKKTEVWTALQNNDILACVFARLLLWTLPQALPRDRDEGWEQYLEAWRPGKPHPNQWPSCWRRALRGVGAV